MGKKKSGSVSKRVTIICINIIVFFFAILILLNYIVFPEIRDNLIFLVITGLMLLLPLSFLIYYILNKLISAPLQELNEAMKSAEGGDLLVRVGTTSEDEIGEVKKGFNALLSKLTQLQASVLDANQMAKWAQKVLKLKDELEKKSNELSEANYNLKKMVEELSLLLDISREINSTLNLSEIMKKVCELVGGGLKFDELVIFLTDFNTGELVVKTSYGIKDEEKIKNLRFLKGEGIVGNAFKSGSYIYVPDILQDLRFLHFKGRHQMEGGSFLAMPVKILGNVIGVLSYYRNDTYAIPDMEIKLLRIIANQVAMAIRNAQMYEKTREMAIHDPLTGLFNRGYFMKCLESEWDRSVRFNKNLSFILLDIDNFKECNDKFGHLFGDEILRKVANAIKTSVRKVDIVGRYGGEEFAVILPETDKENANIVGEKIRKNIEKFTFFPPDNYYSSVKITISGGIASKSDNIKSTLELFNYADKALLSAKNKGKNLIMEYQSYIV